MAAMFLRHEGFLGAVGAFLTVAPNMAQGGAPGGDPQAQARKVRQHRAVGAVRAAVSGARGPAQRIVW
jgi:hypothetical protein